MKQLRVVTVLLCVSALAWAGEPWEKEFKSWTKEDAQKVMWDSPWGKRVVTKEEYVKESEDKTTGGKRTASEMERGMLRPTEFATAVWWSAHTPRRAYLRLFELTGQPVSLEQYKEVAESTLDMHVIALWESKEVMARAAKLPPEELKKAAVLDSPRLKKKIPPAEVKIIESAPGKPDRIVFSFPKEADGQPLVTPEDKRLILKWRLPRTDKETVEKARQFDAQFNPNKMIAAGQPDY